MTYWHKHMSNENILYFFMILKNKITKNVGAKGKGESLVNSSLVGFLIF